MRDALAAGIDPLTILDQGLTAGMALVGACFRANEIFVPEVLVAARAMTAGLALLEPHLAGEHAAQRSTIIIGTVQGDIHDIGKNLVAMMLRGAGHRVIDLGINVPPWISDFSNGLMVQSNGNLVRWMHVTPSKQDVESCDRVGLLQALPAGDSES